MDDVTVRVGIHELIAAYVDCIDEDRLEDWPDFFVEQCRYVVTSHASHAAGLPHGVIYAASRGML
ncbi:MAG: nuclear transport factor 2 family protein, partial [Acetobacteraceae bacterium]|nr:nuclear transport factor 2 family protein [Acetobacteraceae bacterium]